MKEISYKTFSLNTHKKNWRIDRPNICQFELTFGCSLHCKHCYTDCYNNPSYLKRELNTREIKFILDKVYQRGVFWLCFTGGDPLTRSDFLDIYSYAKYKGFIIIIFTNGYSMTKGIASYLKRTPPFVLEITLNAVTRDLYEQISRVKGSFDRVMHGIDLILRTNLPLKIKTQVTKDNLEELPRIKKFIKGLGLKFMPGVFLHARLDGDLAPCNLRVSPSDVLSLDRRRHSAADDCALTLTTQNGGTNNNLFPCTIKGGDGINIDPYGNLIPCFCIREPKVNILEKDVREAKKKILKWVRTINFTNDSKCKNCLIRDSCYNCPGKSLLEKGSLEAVIDWYCELAHLVTEKKINS